MTKLLTVITLLFSLTIGSSFILPKPTCPPDDEKCTIKNGCGGGRCGII